MREKSLKNHNLYIKGSEVGFNMGTSYYMLYGNEYVNIEGSSLEGSLGSEFRIEIGYYYGM